MRIIGISDLVTDYYYFNDKLLGLCGGGTVSNIIANLSNLSFDTYIVGGCGKDSCGQIAIDSLKRVGVNISNLTIKEISTRKFHISINVINDKKTSITKKRCPICKQKDWYVESIFNPDDIIKLLKAEDIIVIDSLNIKSKIIVDKLQNINDIMLDIGYYHKFLYLKLDKIIDILKGNFKIVNMNEKVACYLSKRFKIDNIIDLTKLVKTDLLIITRGKKGADFIFNNKVITKKLTNKAEEIDSNGAGDAFFATIIGEYVNNDLKIDKKMIDKSFEKATTITKEVVSKIGARSHLCNLYKVEEINNVCTCHDLVIIDK